MLEMKATLSKLLLNYKILPDKLGEEIQVKMDLVLRPVNGISVKLESRI
jgi:cytochrome P450 family 4